MGIFRKIYQKIFHFNMKNYEQETKIFEDLTSKLEKQNDINEIVKLAIDAIERVIKLRGQNEKVKKKGLKSLYLNLSKAKTLYEQVDILSKGTGTGWGSMWNADLCKIFKKELRKMNSTGLTPAQPTLESPIKKQEEKNEEQIETFKKNKDQIEGIKEDLEGRKNIIKEHDEKNKEKVSLSKSKKEKIGDIKKDSESKKNPIANDLANIKKSNEKKEEKIEIPKLKEERIAEIKKDLETRKFKQNAIDEIIKAAAYLFDQKKYENENLHFLGKGGFNVVFRIGNTDRIVKYCKSYTDLRYPGAKEGVSVDEMSLRNFEEMLKEIKDPELKKWSEKYLSKSTRINKKDIYEDKLAHGDLVNVTLQNRHDSLLNDSKKKKSMDSLLKKAKKAAKGVLVLHKSGYVHQDIKPENILHLSNTKYPKSEGSNGEDKYGKYTVISEISEKDKKIRYFKKYESGNKRKISKNTINLADYGLMRKIKDEINKTQRCGTPKYEGFDDKTTTATSEDDVKKRDVYALGMTYANLLCASDFGIKNGQYGKQWGEYVKLDLNNFDNWFKSYKPTSKRTLFDLYGDDEKERVKGFVKLINDMTGPRKDRPLMDKVVDRIREIEKLKNDKI